MFGNGSAPQIGLVHENNCVQNNDNSFGPALPCANAFDFTLLFEQSILSISSSAVLLLFLPWHLRKSYASSKKTISNSKFAIKTVCLNVDDSFYI